VIIDVQVGMDFLVECECGWGFRTKSSDELHARIGVHESATGHRWPSAFEEPAHFDCDDEFPTAAKALEQIADEVEGKR
jgi:hypothetical protein